MKKFVFIISIGLLAGTFYFLNEDQAEPESENAVLPPAGSPTITTDGATVFQRGFWKRPGASDDIIHAERREWADEKGVSRWQWFIELSPSSRLQEHLFTRNSFALIERSKRIDSPADRPVWFPPHSSGFETLSSPNDDMVILYHDKSDRLFATGYGGGFVQAAAVPSRSISMQNTVSKGRLPNTSPPDPRQQ